MNEDGSRDMPMIARAHPNTGMERIFSSRNPSYVIPVGGHSSLRGLNHRVRDQRVKAPKDGKAVAIQSLPLPNPW